MPNITISSMPAAGALTGTELVPIVQLGANRITTVADIQAGGGGGPTWTAPTGSFLIWTSGSIAASMQFGDNGQWQCTSQVGSAWTWANGATVEGGIYMQAGQMNVQCVASANIYINCGGTMGIKLDSALNDLTEAGFNTTSRCWIPFTPGNWGGPGVPIDLETAIDRIATAVAGLLAGPIP